LAQLIREKVAAAWDELLDSIQQFAAQLGKVNGIELKWDPWPFLKFEDVAAALDPGTLTDGVLLGCRVGFGRIPSADYFDDNPIPIEVWNLTFSAVGDEVAWNVKDHEIIGMSSSKLAEQIVQRLIIYRDEYQSEAANTFMS